MINIKFGTDGWRAIIADEYTVDNVRRVTAGTALWMNQKNYKTVVVGHDCRFGGEMFLKATTEVFCQHGIKVYYAKDFVSTPMISLGVVKLKADLGIVITASHNPPSYNGYKLKSNFGGPSSPQDITEVENLIPETWDTKCTPFDELVKNGNASLVELENMYVEHAEAGFDLDLIRNSGLKVAYDAMYGAGQRAMLRLLPDVIALHCDNNPSFMGQAPEPIMKNLTELSTLIKNDPSISLGIANDGDADRIGMFDGNGLFVDSHHILLLLLMYMYKYKKLSGEVVVTFSVTDKMRELANKYGLPCEITKIGFKYIAEIMTQRDVLVGGEESGGLAVKGHIPERDGIWIGLMILEFMAATKKSLEELIQDLYDEIGTFWFDRDDLHITEEQKQNVIKACKDGSYSQFGNDKVISTETLDGFKFIYGDERWIMIRPSGTEPVLRVYAQGKNAADTRVMLDAAKATIL
ncbi:MAG: phosphoglucomutase/phosphomannomutase family protein [Saprospiraceae bacterium]|jgi:phosphomannomutase|uniref:phosphoglucomutase/phosphomannomutase family protein n=1 Tax=Candidatus Brachybacter algidus TaxID=2982024 RepID=UPI001B498525|nr:phosphoglucomutase/phosphomannomutase family protein [Candidatus Brachybacter algidus]MBP7305575.1 phosphoglucomutase/phosphomannomutase family protein [Saprospiraceae bacterium]MBK7602526.1 phosphoglucomutase/phosphomannomutase family protein [Candidatus Brachybacter algidus]MBK8354806.1 phosphoglucomutase/phosphomannomutase family protein [Candidatus Brachybacter algidus]MBK8603106.1 phosphoglucomutase/phosphomannomutase family protein [Candidatus Brachybacter algidus]MBK8843628.1 phospho